MTFTRQLIDSNFIISGSWFKFFKFLPTKLEDLNEFFCFFPDKGSKDVLGNGIISSPWNMRNIWQQHRNILSFLGASFVWDSYSWGINQPSGHAITTCYLNLSNPLFPMCIHSCAIDAFCHISVIHWQNINTPFRGSFSTLLHSINNGVNSLFTPRLHYILFRRWPA